MTPGRINNGLYDSHLAETDLQSQGPPADAEHLSVCLLGGLFDEELASVIEADSIGGVQAAANALQWNLVRGLDQTLGYPITIVTAPFVGSFPRRYKRPWLNSRGFAHAPDARDYSVGFLNLPLIKHLFRSSRTWKTLRRWIIATPGKKVIICYSMNSAFMKCLDRSKKLNRSIATCLVVPDLPEYMNTTTQRSRVYSVLKSIDIQLMRKSFPSVDSLVLLTRHMRTRLPDGPPYITLEGIATELVTSDGPPTDAGRTLLYAGSLNARYGILNLLEAFESIDDPEIRLVLCGAGDSENEVEVAAARDARIDYRGRVSREQALDLQREATILVNPRSNEEEFTKYSFPSKILEYLSSGRPVVAYMLDGMPDEYGQYIFTVSEPTAESLAGALKAALSLPDQTLAEMGARARDFVLAAKSPRTQAERILRMVRSVGDELW